MTKIYEIKKLAKRLSASELLVFLADDDIVKVARNTKGNFLPDMKQEMTAREAAVIGAWNTCRGTMSASVTHNGVPCGIIGDRPYAIFDTASTAAWEAEAREPRDTLTCWTHG